LLSTSGSTTNRNFIFTPYQIRNAPASQPRDSQPSTYKLGDGAERRSLKLMVYAQHGRELMGCKSPVEEPWFSQEWYETTTTSQRQGRFREKPSEGSPTANLRADEQKLHKRLSLRASWHNTAKPTGSGGRVRISEEGCQAFRR